MAYRLRGSVHYHHGRKVDNIQADTVLELLRVLHLDPKEEFSFNFGWSFSIDPKAYPYGNTLPPTRPHIL